MKFSIIPSLLILCLSSCITSNNVYYSDPNYLNSNEFSTYEAITTNNQKTESTSNDSTINSNTDYLVDNYYDYSFSSRIRRFHRPIYYSGYYSGIYTDYFWYNNDPFFCGTSIYYGYNWHSPYYSYYSYSPYYYGNYYSYNGYGNHHHILYNTYHTNRNDNDAYITGHRGNLSSSNTIRGINKNTHNNILSNTNTAKNETNVNQFWTP